jgi:hypothetical protein
VTITKDIDATTTMFTSQWVAELIHFNGGKHVEVNTAIPESIEGEIHSGVVLGNPGRVLGRGSSPKNAIFQMLGCKFRRNS